MTLLLVGIVGSASAQRDDLYFVPKKTVKVVKATEMDEDAYNRRGSYLTEQDDTMWTDADALSIEDGEGWVNGFDGSDADYEYAMRIVRFRNPRYAIPVSSPLYWDVVYGGALWPSWEWNVYDDGLYAYVFPTTSNWYYWNYRTSYAWHSPWYNPHFYGYCPRPYYGYHHGHHHGYYPHHVSSRPGWGGSRPGAQSNHRPSIGTAARRGTLATSRTGASTAVSRTGSSTTRVATGANDVVRRSTGASSVSRSSSSSSSRTGYSNGGSSMSRSSGSTSSYSRPSSTRSTSSSSSVSRSSSPSSSSRSSYSSSSSRSSYSSGSSYSGGSRSSSSGRR